MQRVLLCLTAVTAGLLRSSYSTAAAYEHPTHTAVLCLLVSAAVLYSASRWYPQLFVTPKDETAGYELVAPKSSSREAIPNGSCHNESATLQGHTRTIILAVILLALRVEVFRRIRNNEECTTRSYEAFAPLLIAFYDWRSQPLVNIKSEDLPDSSIYDDMSSGLWYSLLRPKWRYIPSTLAIVIGCYGMTSLPQGQTSTVICGIVSGHAAWTPRLQVLGMILDSLLAIIVEHLVTGNKVSGGSPKDVYSVVNVLLGAAGIWFAVILGDLVRNIERTPWILLPGYNQRDSSFWSIIGQAVLGASLVLWTICLIKQHGVLLISIMLTVITTVLPCIHFLWSARQPYPAISAATAIWSFTAVAVGVFSLLRIRQSISPSGRGSSSLKVFLPLLVLFLALWPPLTKPSSVFFHPIDLLMYDARVQHDQYTRFATYSHDLSSAVKLYQARYEGNPPPGFDVWWEFAQNRQAYITDDYDQIHVDLLPFRAVLPKDLRAQTVGMLTDPWNDLAGISIRAGKTHIIVGSSGHHQRMLEGVASLINTFVEHLPDMDLAFNLHNLPRVALSEKELTRARETAKQTKLNGRTKLLQGRATDWPTIEEQNSASTGFEDRSQQSMFDHFATIGCASGSAARRGHHTLFQPYTCTTCAMPHSFGQFLSNWSLAADPCHQPDLAQLYEPYMSPASFKPTHVLRPVFSQSKMYGFSDILYPSIWNYIESIAYSPTLLANDTVISDVATTFPDPPLRNKINSLYWRGSANEGVSKTGRLWRGMARQRLAHMANNHTNSYHDHVTVLLPDPAVERKYSYQTLSAAEFIHLGLETNIHIEKEKQEQEQDDTQPSTDDGDCIEQRKELGAVEPSDFQNHWKHRFLIDLDGPGSTTGHLIPFLKSHSVPLKAGMLREWFDSRLTPWRHFVPLDLRLHGLWSTLAYFAGVDGSIGSHGRPVKWNAHVREAEIIAEQGRDWAYKVLRREDMEIYMFRLLLEWARLTDDRRDELGFDLDV